MGSFVKLFSLGVVSCCESNRMASVCHKAEAWLNISTTREGFPSFFSLGLVNENHNHKNKV